MAFSSSSSANIFLQNKTLTSPPLITPSIAIKLRKYPKFIPKSSSSHQFLLQTHKRRISLTISAATEVASDFQVQEKLSDKVPNMVWEDFARNVSGEWDGHGADFTAEGKPIELPENVVPDAYKEWEVRVFDWQTQCPTLAESESCALFYKLIKLLPTVGCEADAATRYTIEERNVGGIDSKVSAFAYHSSGSYVAVCPMESKGDLRLLELEHCLVDPRNREQRVRIIQIVSVDKAVVSLQSIRVFREHWYGPFRNGEQLGGCAIQDSAFASTGAMKASEVIGVWKGSKFVAKIEKPQTIQELADDKPEDSVRDEKNLVLLPKQVWSSLKEREDGETCGEVGWLFEEGRAITSRCIFSKDGKLLEMAVLHETAVSKEI